MFITYFRDKCQYTKDELNKAEQQNMGGDKLYRAMQQKTAKHIIDFIISSGEEAFVFEADLEDIDNIKSVFDLCEEKLGAVDVLINNHTYCELETFDPGLVSINNSGTRLISKEGIDKHFDINTRSYALLMSEYLNRFLARNAKQGRIINISTDAAHAHKTNISYAASKHAIESYSRSAAIEMGKYGITVNIVSPGPIQTGYI